MVHKQFACRARHFVDSIKRSKVDGLWNSIQIHLQSEKEFRATQAEVKDTVDSCLYAYIKNPYTRHLCSCASSVAFLVGELCCSNETGFFFTFELGRSGCAWAGYCLARAESV